MKKIVLAMMMLAAAPVESAPVPAYNFSADRRPAAAREARERELEALAADDRAAIGALRDGKRPDLGAIEERYLDFLRRHPDCPRAHNYLGGFYYDTGRPGLARRQWLRGLRRNPRDPYLYNNLAEYYGHDAGLPRRAIELTRRAISLRDDEAVFHLNLATYYDVFRYAVVNDYGSPEAVFQRVLASYRRAIELEPDDYGHAFDYARTLTFSPAMWRIGDPSTTAEKIEAWRRCLEIAPDGNAARLARDQLTRLGAEAPLPGRPENRLAP